MKRLLSLLALVAVLAAACSDRGTVADPAALTLEGTSVSVSTVEDQLEALADAPDVVGTLFGQGVQLTTGDDQPGVYDPAGAAALLTLHAQAILIDDLAASRGLEPTADDLAAAEQQIAASTAPTDPSTGQPTGESTFLADLPEDLSAVLVGLVANQNALQADLEEEARAEAPEVSDEEVREAYEQVAPSQTEVCASHILVAFTEDLESLRDPEFAPTDEQRAAAQEGIDAAAQRLADGEEFAAVATEVSDDTASGEAGGDLGCTSPDQYVGPFADAVTTQPIGEVGEVVETQFGFHLIVVTERTEPTFEELEPELREQLEAAAVDVSQVFSELITDRAEAVEVYVDPRFGEWEALSVSVVPPEGAAAPPTTAPVTDESIELPGLPTG